MDFKEKSYYKRPSKALRRGGGFFVPGLKGSELEYLIGGLLLFAFLLNVFTIEEWVLSMKLSLLNGFLAISLWLYLQFRFASYPSGEENSDPKTASKALGEDRYVTFLSIEDEMAGILDILGAYGRVEYLAVYRDTEPFITAPVSLSVGSLVSDIAELLYKNVNKALHFTASPPFQSELQCLLPSDWGSTKAISWWLYPFFCPVLDKRFTIVLCFQGAQRLSSENGKWLTEWVKCRLIPYLQSSFSSRAF